MARSIIKDFPLGPLEKYRKNASFDWKNMKILMYTKEIVIYSEKLINDLKKNSINYPCKPKNEDEEKQLSNQRFQVWIEMQIEKSVNFDVMKYLNYIKLLYLLDPSALIKYSYSTLTGMSLTTIRLLGSEKHQKYVEDTMAGKIIGCYAMTEIGHGSNVKCLRTTATYDLKTKEFILNTPDFEAAKCWAVNLGQCASYAVIYAQMFSHHGQHQGLQLFLVDIRNPKTLIPYSGITIGNMGLKSGLNGLDNGFMIFNNYRIPRENLLNNMGELTEDGTFVCSVKSTEVLSVILTAFTHERIFTIIGSTANLLKAVAIGIRYSGVRKQFGPTEGEIPILEYQTTQWRLLPYLAASYMFTIFCNFLPYDEFIQETDEESVADLHALITAGKVVTGWLALSGIQSCRETCGGPGYLKVSELSDLRSTQDASITYDGENNVLAQQSSNWLLKCWKRVLNGEIINGKFINFLNMAKDILNWKFMANDTREALNPFHILRTYKWLTCYLCTKSYDKLQKFIHEGYDLFTAKNNSQIFFLRSLTIVYFNYCVLENAYGFIQKVSDTSLKCVLLKLMSLYGAWSLNEQMVYLYEGGYASGSQPAYLIQHGILNICEDLKKDAISLVDAIVPHEFLITSPLGAGDGEVYKHLEADLFLDEYTFLRPKWWQEITNIELKSKL